jgi:hypothetical protein
MFLGDILEKTIDKGVICVFDILGYKNFLVNNSLYECADKIRNVILKTPDNVKKSLLEMFQKDEESVKLRNNTNKFFEARFQYIVVSDTIILIFDISDFNGELESDLYKFVSLAYITDFKNESFINGFPMRGCIDIGEVYYYDNVFAGKTIVKCFNESEKINLSGLLLTENAFNNLKEHSNEFTKVYLDKYIHDYNVPMKNNIEEKKHIIDWIRNRDDINDLRQNIFESFNAHNKEINLSVMEKINNTENMCRYLLMKNN